MLDHVRDIESSPHIDQDDSDNKPIIEPQLNVGGHGATQRRLKNYHVTMIGFCSGIGTGLFIGTGSAYANAGPAGLLLAYIIVGSVLWCVMQSIAELATVVGTPLRFIPYHTYHHSDPYCWFIPAFRQPLH
jgi:amino acid transporter